MQEHQDLPQDPPQTPVVPAHADHTQECEECVDDGVDPGQDGGCEGHAHADADGNGHTQDDGASAQDVAALSQGAVEGALQAHVFAAAAATAPTPRSILQI